MRSRAKKILIGLAALVIALLIWIPSVHFFFAKPASAFYQAKDCLRKLANLPNGICTFGPIRTPRTGTAADARQQAEWISWGALPCVVARQHGLRDPSAKQTYLETIDRIIGETLQIEKEKGICVFLMSYAKTNSYVVQPARSLFIDGEIALMLGARRLLEEKLNTNRCSQNA